MANKSLSQSIRQRLDEADSGDRGWWLITRVHLTTARLRDIARYLLDVGADQARELSAADFRALGRLTGVGGADPGVQLRRHHLLAMETPLRLIERTDHRRWVEVSLTQSGVDLARSSNPADVLERSLREIVFCREPFYTATRVAEFSEFDVRPYGACLRVMAACNGWVDRNEFDLFLSRIRTATEIEWAITGIKEYRTLGPTERDNLLSEVRSRISGAKAYQNWRDMGLHTFTLFSLGLSAIRAEQKLMLTGVYLEESPESTAVREGQPRSGRPRIKAEKPQRRALKIPEPAAGSELSVPPTLPAANSGTDAEIFVGKLLQANGWTVVYYSNRRGYGFDIWARKGSAALLIEVKSAVRALGVIALTRTEFEAAQHHGSNYVIAAVENVASDSPIVRFISDPARRLRIEPRSLEVYVIARDDWEPAANESYD